MSPDEEQQIPLPFPELATETALRPATRPAPPSIRRRLTTLVFAAIVPIAVFALLIIGQYMFQERAVLTAQMQASAQAIAGSLDAELSHAQASLIMLSGSRALVDHNLAAFYAAASSATGRDPDRRILLSDSSGKSLLNTRVPFDSPLPPTGHMDMIRQVVISGKPAISNMFFSTGSKSQIVVVRVPVFQEGSVAYVLAMTIPPTSIEKVLADQHLSEGWFAEIIDRDGKIVARTLDPERTRGSMATPQFVSSASLASEGTLDTTRLEGVPVHLVFARAQTSGWTVGLWADSAAINAALWRSWLLLGTGGGAFIGAALLVAAFFGRRIAQPIIALSSMAPWVERGERPPALRLSLKEAQNAADQLQSAGDIFARRIAEREATLETLEQQADIQSRALAMTRACTAIITRAKDEQSLLQSICQMLVDVGGYQLAWVGYAEDDLGKSVRTMARAGNGADYLDQIKAAWNDNNQGGYSPERQYIRTGAIATTRDIAAEPIFGPWPLSVGEKTYRSSALLPMRGAGVVYGTLAAYSDKLDAFVPHETALLAELANDLAFAITALRSKIAGDAAEGKLRQAFAYARALLDASLDPLVSISTEGKITDVNKATERVTGLTRRQLIGSDFADCFTQPEKARAVNRQMLAKDEIKGYRLAIRSATGTIIDVLYNASRYRDEHGAIADIFASARDITALKRAERELFERGQHRPESVDAGSGNLSAIEAAAPRESNAVAAMVTLDLRTRLEAMDGFTGRLLDEYKDRLDPEAQHIVGLVRQASDRMVRLLDDMLVFSRVADQELTATDVDMNLLVQEALKELAPMNAGRQPSVNVKPLPPIRGDAPMLRRLWIELLANAIKITASDPAARIEIGATRKADETIYFVKDNDGGVDHEFVDQPLDAVSRLPGVDEFRVTTVGLAIAKRIIGRHDGRIWEEAAHNAGTTFFFSLPSKDRRR